jgi:hypothetical protein
MKTVSDKNKNDMKDNEVPRTYFIALIVLQATPFEWIRGCMQIAVMLGLSYIFVEKL